MQVAYIVSTYGPRTTTATIESIPEKYRSQNDGYFIYNGSEFPSWSAMLNKAIRNHVNDYDVLIVVHDDVILGENTSQELIDALGYLDMAMAFDKDRPESQSQPNAFCFTITPKLIEKVGYFDEGFEKYLLEDIDYFYRIELAGLIARSVTGVAHIGGISTRELTPDEHDIWVQNYVRYIIKWGGPIGEEKFIEPFNGLTEEEAIEIYAPE
jgi:hypothetical protein